MARILFILKESTNKCYSKGSFGLSNSASFVANRLERLGHNVRLVKVLDANYIDREVHRYRPDIVIIEALWVAPPKLEELVRLHPRQKWIIRIHSKIPFLAMEGVAFSWINKYKEIENNLGVHNNLYLTCNSLQFNKELNAIKHVDSVYLPNIYCPSFDEIIYHKHHQFRKTIINIGCFGAIRPLKNQLIQAVAAMLFANRIGARLHFHINGTRPEQAGENVLKNLEALFEGTHHTLIKHEWYSHEEFVTKTIPEMDLGMQVSFSESFNIVTADFVFAGVPIVVSDDVDWMPAFTRVGANSAEEIAKKLYTLWVTRTNDSVLHNRKFLRKYNENATEEWENFIRRLMHGKC